MNGIAIKISPVPQTDPLSRLGSNAARVIPKQIRPIRSSPFNMLRWVTFRKWQIVRAW